MIAKKPKNFLNNKDILKEFRLSKEQGKMTEEFGKMMIALATKYSKHSKWVGYSYRDDMVCNAILTLCKVWESFDDTKYDNPFAYYTQVCTNSFIQQLNSEKRQRDIKDEIKVEAGLNASYDYKGYESNSDDMDTSEQYDNAHESHLEDVDDTVYDVTDEYVESAVKAAFSSEPELVIEEEIDEEELEYNNQLIKEYLDKVTPKPTGLPKQSRARKGRKVRVPKPPRPTPTPTNKSIKQAEVDKPERGIFIDITSSESFIKPHKGGGLCVILQRNNKKTFVKVNKLFHVHQEAYDYRDMVVDSINQQIKNGVEFVLVPNPLKHTRKMIEDVGTSGHKFVVYHKQLGKWVVKGMGIRHGTFKTIEEAVVYRDQELERKKEA